MAGTTHISWNVFTFVALSLLFTSMDRWFAGDM